MLPSFPWLIFLCLMPTEVLKGTAGDRHWIFRMPVLSLDCIRSLTHRDPLITVRSCEPVTASATVVATEIPITLASAVEKSQRPPLSVITSGIGVLGSVAAVVCCDGHTLPPPCAWAALVPCSPCRRWAALTTPQPLGRDALPGELGQRLGDTQGHHQETHSPHATKIQREERSKKGECEVS